MDEYDYYRDDSEENPPSEPDEEGFDTSAVRRSPVTRLIDRLHVRRAARSPEDEPFTVPDDSDDLDDPESGSGSNRPPFRFHLPRTRTSRAVLLAVLVVVVVLVPLITSLLPIGSRYTVQAAARSVA